MSNKPNYGFDAPSVIRWLFVFAAVSFGIGYFAYSTLLPQNEFLANMVCGYFCLTGATFLIPGFWMIYGTQAGKQKILAQAISELHLQGNETILDAGCGRGMFLIEAAKRLKTGRAYGIEKDPSGNHPENTLQNAELEGVRDRIEVQTGDLTALPFSEGEFDLVLSSFAIHTMEEEEERDKALSEILRVLKKGGRFLLIDWKNTRHYAESLQRKGAKRVELSSPIYRYFPPVRIVKGKKE